jgi:methylamine dehydrogenase accessory protein MauD
MVSQILLFILVVGLAVAGVALARQIGILHERVAPVGALTPRQGPAVNEIAPQLTLPTLAGDSITIGGILAAGANRLLLFVSPQCPICKKLIPIAKRMARSDKLELIFAGDGDPVQLKEMVEAMDIAAHPFVNSRELGMAFGVDKLPHAVLLSAQGVIYARGLVNSREHLESMVVARDLGVASVQEYLRRRPIEAA